MLLMRPLFRLENANNITLDNYQTLMTMMMMGKMMKMTITITMMMMGLIAMTTKNEGVCPPRRVMMMKMTIMTITMTMTTKMLTRRSLPTKDNVDDDGDEMMMG